MSGLALAANPAMLSRLMRALVLACLALVVLTGCEATCTSDAECAAPAVCGSEGKCLVPVAGPDGAACSDDRHCAGGACLFSAEGGRCATACASAADCPTGRCALAVDTRADTSRLRLTCGPGQGDRFYAETCADDGQCRSGVCHDGRCTSPCGTCPADFDCQPTTLTRLGRSLDHGVCTWWPVQPVIELGPAATTDAAPTVLSFELPAGVGAFTLVLEDFEDRVPAVTRLTGPDGTVFIGNPADGGVRDLARCASGPGQATVLVPGSDEARATPGPGRYTLEVVTYEPMGFPVMSQRVAGRVERVAAVFKRPTRGGVVDVKLKLAPEVGYSVADGGGTWVRALLTRFEEVTRDKLGVALGQVQMELLPPDAGVVVSTAAQSRALWTQYSEGAPTARPVNVMVVDSLTFAGGISGGNPGAPGVYGRPASGVTLEPLASGPQATGVLMAHEVLHYLGLFHTSDEYFGADLISDTPECANPAGSGCADARNLMFPYFPTREPLSLSAGQVKVLEGSPWVYRWLHPGACGAHDVVGLGAAHYASGSTVGAPAVLTGACGGSGGEQVHLLRLEGAATKLEASVSGSGFSPVLYLRRADCDASGTEVACVPADGGVAAAAIDNPTAGAYFVVVDSLADGGAYALDVTVTP